MGEKGPFETAAMAEARHDEVAARIRDALVPARAAREEFRRWEVTQDGARRYELVVTKLEEALLWASAGTL